MSDLNAKILSYNKQVPRYTSYPAAPYFTADVNAETYIKWLKELPEDTTLSLYFHIPFCPKMCWYCGCHTKVTNRYAPVEDYVHLLKREIRLISDLLKHRHSVTHIHFGGGSPTILQPDDFTIIMEEVREHFTIDEQAEIAIELDPRNVTEEKVIAYAKQGVNRSSLGVQDFHEDVQEAVNRVQPFDVVYDSVKLLKKYGIDHLNVDLMYGLPNQTLESIKENISYTMLLKPERISFFGYAHVPWMKKQMRLIDEEALPDSEERLIMFQEATKHLEESGYLSIGLDHFVRKGDSMEIALNEGTLRRSFQGYTTDHADALIGFGASSIGKLPQGYVQNVAYNKDYQDAMMSGVPAIVKGIALSEEDKIHQHIIEQLMCELKVDIAEICTLYKIDTQKFDEAFTSLLPLQKDGLINVSETKITVKSEAKQIVRVVCAAFDQFRAVQEKRHSQVA